MPRADTLKEYLIKLGWDVDEVGYDRALGKVGQFEVKSKSLFGRIANYTIQSSAYVLSFITTVDTAIVKLFSSVAQADLATERFARQMWTTEENARSFQAALDAIGANSYEDLFWMTPEEYSRFQQLRSLGNQLQAPAELNDMLKKIRDIQFEFNRMKVIANYATQWVVYYLSKYLGTDIQNVHDLLRNFNDWVIRNLPQITEKIAKFLANVYKLGRAGAWAIGNLIELIAKLWSHLSGGAKATIAFGAGFAALLKTGPIGMFMAAIVGLLLLLEDLYTYMHGGDSLFGDFWEKLLTWKNDNSGKIGELTDDLSDLGDTLRGILTTIGNIIGKGGELVGKFVSWADKVGILGAAFDLLKATLVIIDEALQGISDGLDRLLGSEPDTTGRKTFGEKFAPIQTDIMDRFGAFNGKPEGEKEKVTQDLAEAIDEGNKMIGDFFSDVGSYFINHRDYSWVADFGSSVSGSILPSGGFSGVDAASGAAKTNVTNNTYNNNIQVSGVEKGKEASTASETAKRVLNNEKRINQLK